MAVKTDEIRSADDLAVSPVKELSTGGHAWDPNKIYQKETVVTEHDPGFHGQFSHKQFYSLADNNLGNDPMTDKVNWIEDNLVRYLASDTTITVGTGGDFLELSDALGTISKYIAVNLSTITIMLKAGYIQNKQIKIKHLSFNGVEIDSEDGVLNVDMSALPDNEHMFDIVDTSFPTIKCNISVFSCKVGAENIKSYLFNLDSSSLTLEDGIMVEGSLLDVGDRIRTLVYCRKGSKLIGQNISYRRARILISANGGSVVNINGSTFKNFTDIGVACFGSGTSVAVNSALFYSGYGSTVGAKGSSSRIIDGASLSGNHTDFRAKGFNSSDNIYIEYGIVFAHDAEGGSNLTPGVMSVEGMLFK